MQYYTNQMRSYVQQATRLLGEPAIPVRLEFSLRNSVWRQLRLEVRKGLLDEPAWMAIDESRQGHSLYVGLARYRWEVDGELLRVVLVAVPPDCGLYDFWAVPASQLRSFYRRVRRQARVRAKAEAPLMAPREKHRLWNNTVGLLCRSQSSLERFGVAMKRGVLLLGEPGNGKTMACRWLAKECRRNGLEWRNVTSEKYQHLSQNGRQRELFDLASPGIVMFDDLDEALRDRGQFGPSDRSSTFLTELDGFRPKSGMVFLFTTNHAWAELDPAVRRPGRIDVAISFPRPSAELRRRCVEETWQAEILAQINAEQVVRDTDGFSFAEIEESRRLLVMHFFETQHWSWPAALRGIEERNEGRKVGSPIGFSIRPSEPDESLPTTSAEHGSSQRMSFRHTDVALARRCH